ncbi:multiple sugar transport system permease protein [Diaminobutyricimonas aerilata]|uniref:Multiple sugar transport system permease protein n=1 Tax=Diaminobutyricimonas aerilata TaxID=1162967 RepID=A0A2M9CG60_9MICO|nr:carbohydrate ABC transporter permease [Diaminobutyricimonas aerilata]PJJ70835.1 multiple sugar transport system permease protein [Diaminobutyricimonas aerilata]
MSLTTQVSPAPVAVGEERPAPPRRRERRPFSIGRVLGWVVLIVSLVLTLFPFYWMLKTALTPAADVIRNSSAFFPDNPTIINFARVLGFLSPDEDRAAGGSGASINFLLYLWNSVVYCGLIGFFQTLFCAMGGYAFARLKFPARNALFSVLIAALMVPGIFTLLPNFVLVRDLGLLDNLLGMVAPSLLMTPFAIFFMRQFFLNIPVDVEEAALLDGAGKARVFWRIALPMSKGPLITIGLITVVWAWKDFLWPLLIGRDESVRTVTVGLGVYLQQSPNTQPDWTGLMAGSTLSVIPVLILLVFLGRRIVESLNFTGIK